jgi:3'-phosphoadenosine 5'-phosphosulfate sulfotransferase (PAPS reductase)/FAD synthetase
MKITNLELQERLKWNLNQKIDHSLGVIEQMYEYTSGKIYISFSGGKDSVVLLHLVRFLYSKTKAVFFNTTNEFPEIYYFLKSIDNLEKINPDYNLKSIIDKCGFPLISKEQAKYIREVRHTKSEKLLNNRINGRIDKKYQGKISQKWQFLIKASFEISEKCCYYLKKKPSIIFTKNNNLYPIIGVQAGESSLRKQDYLNTGCNSFDEKNIRSKPLSIWTTKDIWDYIKLYKIPYCDIYDKGETQTGCMICGFGCHKDNRFERLKNLHPKAFEIGMNLTNNGVTYKDALIYTFGNKIKL